MAISKYPTVPFFLSVDECEIFLNHIGHSDNEDVDVFELIRDIYSAWRIHVLNSDRRKKKPVPPIQVNLRKLDIMHKFVHPMTFGARCSQVRFRISTAYHQLIYGEDPPDEYEVAAERLIKEAEKEIFNHAYSRWAEEGESQ